MIPDMMKHETIKLPGAYNITMKGSMIVISPTKELQADDVMFTATKALIDAAIECGAVQFVIGPAPKTHVMEFAIRPAAPIPESPASASA